MTKQNCKWFNQK